MKIRKVKPHTADCNDINDKSANEICVCNEAEHTPTPWTYTRTMELFGDSMAVIDGPDKMALAFVSDKNLIDTKQRDADAAFIVRAVNSHEELLSLLKETEKWIMVNHYGAVPFLDSITSAISKAEGK